MSPSLKSRSDTASGPLLQTKLYIHKPRRGQVGRRRLLERLRRGTDSKLTLLSAPAGFGKTTLLAEWLDDPAADERSTAWLSLDPGDSQALSFWPYVIAALQTVAPGVGAESLSLLRQPQPPPIELVLAPLVNELSTTSHQLVLVLDDYHVIDADDVHRGMAFLLEHLPPQTHVVIATRADPPLPLARLRGRAELVEIRAADLRFTPGEALAYLNEVMDLNLAAQDVAALEGRTEGWIAALQLAALSIQGRDDVAGFIAGFAGDDRYIVDYLVEEVLQRQPDHVRSFLLGTSILDRLTGSLCDAVTGQAGGKARLEALDDAGVTPLRDEADVLAVRLVGHGQLEAARQLAYLGLAVAAERKAQPIELCTRRSEEKIALVALGIASPVELGARRSGTEGDVMPGGERVCLEVARGFQ